MDKSTYVAFKNLKESLKGFFDDVKSGDTPSKSAFDYTIQAQAIKSQVISELACMGLYKRDDGRIIISAPEVIIGNVDKTGVLYAGSASKVTIRANDVSLECPAMCSGEGVYSGGKLAMSAPTIVQEAVNPGLEGEQSVVCAESKIVSRAKSIVLDSQNAGDCFVLSPQGEGEGIHLSSYSDISLQANQVREVGKSVENAEKGIASAIEKLTNQITEATSSLEDYMKELDELQKSNEELVGDDFQNAGNFMDIEENIEQFISCSNNLNNSMSSCEKMIRSLAELKRIDKSFKEGSVKAYCDALPTEANSPSNGSIVLVSDQIGISAVNGNGEETDLSSVSIGAKNVSIFTSFVEEETMKGSSIGLHAETIALDTVASVAEGGSVSIGGVAIGSKSISLFSQDISKDGVLTPTEGGSVNAFAKDVVIGAMETKEGKADGSFLVNMKDIKLSAVDQDLSDAENIKDKELSAEGKIELFAKNLQIGNIGEDEEKLKTEKITIVGKEVLVDLKKAEDKFDLNQEDAPIVDITGSKTTIKSKEGFGIEEGDVTIKTNVTIEGKTEFKDEAKGTKVVAQNVEASAGVKTPKVDK